MARAANRMSFSRVVAAGLFLGAGAFGALRATNAEPIPVVPPPISVAEPRPDPNAPALPTLGTFPLPALPITVLPPALPIPAIPGMATPVAPKPAEIPQLTQPVVPMLPTVPEQPANPEKSLRSAPMPLNLIPTAPVAPTPLAPEAIPVGNEVPQPPRKIGNEILVPPAPVVDRLPSPRPVSVPTDIKPPAPLTITPPMPALGDAPMLSLKKLTLSTTMGVALALAPTSALRAEEPKTIQLDVKAVETALKKEIADLKEELKKSKELLSSLDELVMGRKDAKVMVPADAGLMARMEKIEKAIKSIDEAMSKRTVGSSPLEGAKPATGMGRVKVVNEFTTKISIMVNGTSYPLDPSQAKEIEVPRGSFDYLLIAEGATKTMSAIKDGETVTLRIR